VSALGRGFEVLECFASTRRPIGNGEVAQLTGIPRATVSRLIATLVSLGQLRPAKERDLYELASGVVRLAQAFLGAFDVRHHARPHVVTLAETTGASAFIGIRDGDDMLVIEGARSRSAALLISADIGTRMAISTSALGRAWLAGVDETTRRSVVDRWRREAGRAARCGTSLDQALAQAWQCGYALSIGEWHPNINAVAVPVSTASGEVISLNCGSPAFVLPADRLVELVVPKLLKAAKAMAHDIGGLYGAALMATHGHLPADVAGTISRQRSTSKKKETT
jgi:DNA-binding IclR family transcriptional regulator